MIAEIITIGDEILIGQTVDSNSAWIAQRINSLGISVHKIISIPDQRKRILKELKEAMGSSDLVIITGGLGPTKDDITKSTLAEYFDSPLTRDEELLNHIKKFLHGKGVEMNEFNKNQAIIPEKCRPITNHYGTAPGMWFEQDGKICISLPGVPYEMKEMMDRYVLADLKKTMHGGAVYQKTVLTQGIPESHLATILSDWENNLPGNIGLAYLPSPGMVKLRISSHDPSGNQKKNRRLVEEYVGQLAGLIPEHVFGYDQDTMEKVVGELLVQRKQTLSVAESCTGGKIAHLITSVPGSSGYFKGSVVAYSNEIKEKILKVKRESLNKHGAVSEQVVLEMAHGIRKIFGTDYSLATSGIAGPAGGSKQKPVGTTWIAVETPSISNARRYDFGDNRERNILKAALSALNLLRIAIPDRN